MSEAPAPSRRLLRFGAFELDARTGELRKDDVRVTLQEQPLKVLECLLERPGELVTREELRQRLWQGDTFVDFDHGVNAAVKRLRETLGDSAETPRFIETLPRRGYRFIAPVEQEPPVVDADMATAGPSSDDGDERPRAAAELATHPKRWSGRLAGAAVAGLLVMVALSAWLLSRSRQPPALPMKVVPLTSLTGFEIGPTLSPDGTRVAFTWNGVAQDNWDIYVQMAGSADVHRLSTNPAWEINPIWSPDGRQIAYLRNDPEGKVFQVWVMSAIGGAGHRVSDLPVFIGISWSPDGRYINAAQVPPHNGIFRIPVQGGEPRAILRPTAPETVGSPSFSLDGHFLAYTSCQEPFFNSDCHVQMVAVDAGSAVHGAPRPLTQHPVAQVEGIAWSRDGQFLVYAAGQERAFSLWRVGVDGKRPPERIEVAGINATAPVITRSGDLAFSRRVEDVDVYRSQPGRVAEPVATSAVFDGNPQFSPDGLRFAFCSTRSDAEEVWTAASDEIGRAPVDTWPGQLAVFACVFTRRRNDCVQLPDRRRRLAYLDGRWHGWDPTTESPRTPANSTTRHGRGTETGFTFRGTREAAARSGGRISKTEHASN